MKTYQNLLGAAALGIGVAAFGFGVPQQVSAAYCLAGASVTVGSTTATCDTESNVSGGVFLGNIYDGVFTSGPNAGELRLNGNPDYDDIVGF